MEEKLFFHGRIDFCMTWGRFGESDWLVQLGPSDSGGIQDSGTRELSGLNKHAQISVLNRKTLL